MRDYKYKGYAKEEYIKSQWFVGYGVRKCQMWEAPDRVLLLTEHNGEIEVYGESVGQYTGLKDKNGTEIYEGDIVRHFEEIGIVKWVKDRFLVSWKNINCSYREDLAFWAIERSIEVVGNNYDNPELLERGA